MALIVEDGTGLATANAYISETFANTYHSERCNEGWAGATTQKEAAIRKATEYLDREFCFRGSLVKDHVDDPPQALAWPRVGVDDNEGRVIDDESVPLAVERACAELALSALVLGKLDGSFVTGRLLRSTERVGDVSNAATYDGGVSIGDLNSDALANPLSFPIAIAILRPLLSGMSQTIVRA